jgi:class 3 adenylate cyclase
MFSDLVGSTALSARMDPEDLREVVSAYQKCVTETVRRFDGFVAKYLGDCVLVYFGYPQAHEDDAERAVRTGLELITAVAGLKTLASLQTRVGIATGLVVVGDLIGSGEAQERGIVGETPNLAARPQSIAEPNTVVVAESTRRLVGNLFELQDLGARDLKGIAGSVLAWAALRPSKVESRFEAQYPSGGSPLLGREEELDLLLRHWEQIKRGEGRVVVLTGEPGIGKSRLARALCERVRSEPHTPLIYHCSPYHQDSALYPVIRQLLRAASIGRDDDTDTKLDKLESLLAQSSENLVEDMPLFAALLSIPGGHRYPLSNLTPQRLKERTLGALIAYFKRLAARQPVLIVFEDLHWVDPTSLEMLSLTIDQIPGHRIILLANARPEFTPPWPSHRHISTFSLSRLGRSETIALVAGVTKGKSLPAEILD